MNSGDINKLFGLQLEFSGEIRKTSYKDRIKKIKKIKSWIYENRSTIQKALKDDLSKPTVETDITEIWVIFDMANDIIKNLKQWMSVKAVSNPLPVILSRSSIEYYPKGVCLIIAPWNYPFQLCIAPLLYAIAGGNCAVIKPSEITPHTSKLVFDMMGELFDQKEVSVVEGAKEESKELLGLPFNHIFFTGSESIGKKVVQASSRFLSSLTLELGGKSPVVVDKKYNLGKVVNRLVATKFLNLGQSCIAPDYVIISEDDYKDFLNLLIKKIRSSYGDSFKEQLGSSSLARIVNKAQHSRLVELINNNKDDVVYGGEYSDEDLFIAPTVMKVSNHKEEPLKEEIFGPIIPIVTFLNEKDLESMLLQINNPLALYIFSNNRRFINKVKNQSSSGAVCINDIAAQFLNHNLPFGGVMSSGSGRYHGYAGFQEFSNQRSVIHQSKINFLSMLSAPYTKGTHRLVEFLLKLYNKYKFF